MMLLETEARCDLRSRSCSSYWCRRQASVGVGVALIASGMIVAPFFNRDSLQKVTLQRLASEEDEEEQETINFLCLVELPLCYHSVLASLVLMP